ncbi:MAG: glycoside hydrolase family 2 TIM barrel-domain containing protein [Eubacteriales bacterium]|nr:glycoside hydrolase family 2 TIM barrel-domain containing protein [Eubacteriales bacterium]
MRRQTACYIKDYPRPQMVRKSWSSLNGDWAFRFDDEGRGEKERWYENFQSRRNIRVPFSYETKASGIEEEKAHFCVWYARTFDILPDEIWQKRVLLHFEGCDYRTTVWINGKKAGQHEGGYTRFSIDITDYLADKNEIVVRAEDSFDARQLRGKQRWREESFRCWYVQTTGIWKTVWMEIVNEVHITSLKLTPMPKDKRLGIDLEIEGEKAYENVRAKAEISFEGRLITAVDFPVRRYHTAAVVDVTEISEDTELDGIHYWSADRPNLYDIEISLFRKDGLCDQVASYFGMREIVVCQGNILLNGEPLYQRLILDQGYWKETGLTPPDEDAIIEDIRKTKELGFNGARKHQKIEDERYYYWCDVLGLLVWCEIPSAYCFEAGEIRNYMRELAEIVEQHYSHPSILVWTAFNESWGINEIRTNTRQQHFAEAAYHTIKALDGTRLVLANDGWEHTVSDIITLHDYEEDAHAFSERYEWNREEILDSRLFPNLQKPVFAQNYRYTGQPVMISEFGGIAFQNGQPGWGYGNKVKNADEFVKRYKDIVRAVGRLQWACGYCYTQLTDVQQEINGLMDEERNFKINPRVIRAINEERYNSRIQNGCGSGESEERE